MKASLGWGMCVVGMVCLSLAAPALGVNIETVLVGNPGNAGELSGTGAGGSGPDRICGAVDYIYNIGKFEVTAGQYCEFLNAVAAEDTYGLYNLAMDVDSGLPYSEFGCNIKRIGPPGNYSYSVLSDWRDRPVNYVSWADAARFCNWLHNGQPVGNQDQTTTEDGSYDLSAALQFYGPNGETPEFGTDEWSELNSALLAVTRALDATWVIPSEDEWYKAAYHRNDGATDNYFDYPTGSDGTPSNVVGSPDPGNSANYYDFAGTGNGTWSIGSPYFRTEVGEFENSDSCYGTFDQGGNLFEWNEVIMRGAWRGLRGGSSDIGALSLHARRRDGHVPTGEYASIGLRVAQVPKLTLFVDVVNGGWGSVEPNLTEAAAGSSVTLTATPIEGKELKHWEIYDDPNYIGDVNYAGIDANSTTTILMDHDKGVAAVFKCGSSAGPMLPMMLGVLGLFVAVRGRR